MFALACRRKLAQHHKAQAVQALGGVNSFTKILLMSRDVYDRRDFGDNDFASEVETGGFENPLSTQLDPNVGSGDAVTPSLAPQICSCFCCRRRRTLRKGSKS